MPKLSREDIAEAMQTDVSLDFYSGKKAAKDDEKGPSYYVIDWGRKGHQFVVEIERGLITDIVNTKVDHTGKAFYIEPRDDCPYHCDRMGLVDTRTEYGSDDFSYTFYTDKLKEEFVGENLDYLKGYIMVCENRKLGIFEKEIDENDAKKAFLTRSKNMTIEQKIAEGREKTAERRHTSWQNEDPLAEKAKELDRQESDLDRLDRYQSMLYSKYSKRYRSYDRFDQISEVDLDKRLKTYKKTKSLKEVSKLQEKREPRKSRFRPIPERT